MATYKPRLEELEPRLLPSAGVQEQLMLDAINRLRANPTAELSRILAANDPYVTSAMTAFHVDRATLASQFAALTPAPALVWNDALAAAALGHSKAMLAAGQQSHQLPGEPFFGTRIVNAGYNYTQAAENVYAYAHTIFDAEAAFAVDWGNATPGHRTNLMNPALKEVGIGLVSAPAGSSTGPLLVTQDFGAKPVVVVPPVPVTFSPPIMTGPGASASPTPTISWTPVAGAVRYDLWVNNTSTGQSQVIRQQTLTGTSFTSGALPAGTYTAWVQAYASNGRASGWSSPLTFTVAALPAPAISAVSWGAVPGAAHYDVWVNSATTGQSQIVRVNVTGTVWQVSGTLPRGSYRFWVRAVDSAGNAGGWSGEFDFGV